MTKVFCFIQAINIVLTNDSLSLLRLLKSKFTKKQRGFFNVLYMNYAVVSVLHINAQFKRPRTIASALYVI